MPYDSVYSEKRTPGVLRTVWRKFYGDTTAMIGLYGCTGLVLLCVFGSWFAPYGIDRGYDLWAGARYFCGIHPWPALGGA